MRCLAAAVRDSGVSGSDAPSSECACWSVVLVCSVCNGPVKHSNDNDERVHLQNSMGKEEKLRQQRARARSKRGVEAMNGERQNNRRGRGVKLRNVQVVAAAVLSGQEYSQYADAATLAGDATVCDRTWERYSSEVWTAAEVVTTRELTRCIRSLCDAGDGIGVAADGAWNKRREAPQHCLALLHKNLPVLVVCIEKPVVGVTQCGDDYVVRPGNYQGSSKGMEGAAWECVAAELDAIDKRFRNLVRAVCVDRDASVTNTITVTVTVCTPWQWHVLHTRSLFFLCLFFFGDCRKHSRLRPSTTTQVTSPPMSETQS